MKPGQQVVLASSNRGKLLELQFLGAESGLKLLAQSDFVVPEVAETGASFIENALIKARHCAKATGLPSIGDDSGLIVPALNGAPGLRSARYAGQHATDLDNIDRLLQQMQGCTNRAAFFHCTLVLLRHSEDADPLLAQGRWCGRVAESPQGQGGFGYDPIFICDQHKCSAAELDFSIKNCISHRAQAMQAFKAALASYGQEP